MTDPIIKSFIQEYLADYELESKNEYVDFELFACYCVFSSFNCTGEEFDVTKVHTGQSRDTGLDGIGILIDDILVDSEEEAENIIGDNKNRTFKLEFIFLQAKLKNSFDPAVVRKTIDAVKDFFSDYRDKEPEFSRSEKIKQKALLASYLLKNYIGRGLREKPRCNIYYISTSSKKADSTIKNKQSKSIKKLEEISFLSDIYFEFWGSDNIEKLYRQTKLQVEAIIQVNKSFGLKIGNPKVNKVYITAISFPEFKKIILQDQKIRDFIFYDNVRGFLGGDNKINEAIQKTLKSQEEITLFPLLNNGVTIITKELIILDEDKYKLIDYQIVNGCQTSHVLNMCKELPSTDNTIIPVKIIETDNDDIRNKIIKATNSQTEIKKEFLAALSDFSKKLEDYYEMQASKASQPLYYERRPGQFFFKKITSSRIVKIRPQIKTFVAMFLDEPHNVAYFDKQLTERIGNDIFDSSHYPIAYYTSYLAFHQLDRFYKKFKIPLDFSNNDAPTTVKYYMLMILKYLVIDRDCPSCKNKKEIEKYCNELIGIIDDFEKSKEIFAEATKKLCNLAKKYIQQSNNSEIDNINYEKLCKQSGFTDFILMEMRISNKNISSNRRKDIDNRQMSLFNL